MKKERKKERASDRASEMSSLCERVSKREREDREGKKQERPLLPAGKTHTLVAGKATINSVNRPTTIPVQLTVN